MKNAILPLSDSLKKLESIILRISKSFPDPFNDDLSSFLARISKANKEENTSSISQREQAVVGAVVKIDQFNSSIAFNEKLLSTGQGEKKVLILYFGLGIAYYTDEKGNKAGYLLPGNEWVDGTWKTRLRTGYPGSDFLLQKNRSKTGNICRTPFPQN